ncbi:MAG: RNase adaptor protein RapZ, partial [Vicinamibacteria bacterium]
ADTAPLLARLTSFLRFVIPRYIREGKSYLAIGIGCTGGRHRSVMISNALGRALSGRGYTVRVRHRDLGLP